MILNTFKNPFLLLFTFCLTNVTLFYFSEYFSSPYSIESGNSTFLAIDYLTYVPFTFNYFFGVSLSLLLIVLCLLKFFKLLLLSRAILILTLYFVVSSLLPSYGLFSDMTFNRLLLLIPGFFCLLTVDYLNRFQVILFLYDQLKRAFLSLIEINKNMLMTLKEKKKLRCRCLRLQFY